MEAQEAEGGECPLGWVGQVLGEADRAYLAAEAEAQGQEAGEEILAPSDHAGEAPAQSSHVDEGGCLGREGRGKRTGCCGSGFGGGRGVGEEVDQSPAPGRPGSSAQQEQPQCLDRSTQRRRRRSLVGGQQCDPDVPPSPRKPLREALPPSGTSSAAPSLLPSA